MNTHEIVVCGVPFETEYEKEALKQLKQSGVTSIQIYIFWNQLEPERRGAWEWSFYDREVSLIKEAGLKFVPFILIGPKYAAPKWWLESLDHRGLCCLEHQQYTPIESIWNKAFRKEVVRVLEEFAQHYLPMDVLESIQPGICGDYGEAIFPVLGNWPGDYHTHKGYWCNDPDAIIDYRNWVLNKYDTIEKINNIWRSHYHAIEEIKPIRPHKWPSRTAYFDFLEWYRGSMTHYAEFWMSECRRIFGKLPIYLCTGGVEEPQHGSLFSAQAKIAGKYKCGIRLTNEGNKFFDNYFYTAYTKNACDYYKAYMGLEPVGPITEKGFLGRMFSSAIYGNKQMFHYYYNLFGEDHKPLVNMKLLEIYGELIQERKQSDALAMFWPGLYAAWQGEMPMQVKEALTYLRKMRNCMPVDEEMIWDGILEQYKLLIIPVSCFTKREVLIKIANWVCQGGCVFAVGKMTDLELEDVWEYNSIFGITQTSEEAFGHCRQYIEDNELLETFRKIDTYNCEVSWLNLHDEVEYLARAKAEKGYANTSIKTTSSAFYKKEGKGKGIFYSGPVHFNADTERLFKDEGIFKSLLMDIVKQCDNLPDLTSQEDEIVRGYIGKDLYALTNTYIKKI